MQRILMGLVGLISFFSYLHPVEIIFQSGGNRATAQKQINSPGSIRNLWHRISGEFQNSFPNEKLVAFVIHTHVGVNDYKFSIASNASLEEDLVDQKSHNPQRIVITLAAGAWNDVKINNVFADFENA